MGISQNTSALALMAKIIPENTGGFIPVLSVLLSISAILTSFLVFISVFTMHYQELLLILQTASLYVVRNLIIFSLIWLHLLRSCFFGDGLLPMCLQWHYSNGLWEPLD